MSRVRVGLRAVELPWLCPSPTALLALASEPVDSAVLSADPAFLAHLARFARPSLQPIDRDFAADALTQPSLCLTAATFLESTPAYPTIQLPERLAIIRQYADVAAMCAATLAGRFEDCSPEAAATAARLAPLGWYVVATLDPAAALTALDDESAAPNLVQERHWGMSAQSISRRLLSRWRTPEWLNSLIGFLPLHPSDVRHLAGSPHLFEVVWASINAVERRVKRLGLGQESGTQKHPLLTDAEFVVERISSAYNPAPTVEKGEVPNWVLARLLRATAGSRRQGGAVWLAQAEARIDQLTETIHHLRTEFDHRLRDAQLEGLAEFAAGASHEINNPLAVISGHAQMLLAGETAPDRKKQLETIVRQTKRVHDLLQGVLHFARAPKVTPGERRFRELLSEVVAAIEPEARQRNIQLEYHPSLSYDPVLRIDATLVTKALHHLIRNAIEAAGPSGWVHVRGEDRGDTIAVCIEDSGPGPEASQVKHLFNPFFSGRNAARGKGLGLPIAWRLARAQGGDVRLETAAGQPTRFVYLHPNSLSDQSTSCVHRQSA